MGIKIKTKSFGEVEVDEKQVVDFPDGILGFDFVKKFIILDTDDPHSPLKWMQAFDEPDLAFVIIQPIDFMDEYELKISQYDLEAIGTGDVNTLLVFAIVTIPENPADMTANLQGPVIINPEKNIGRQAISLSDKYQVKHRVLEEVQKRSREEGE